ncbi:MAG: GNAT family N-acetyltransferase [Ruminococcus sp.]|nr:GNAT family N-acetyltransferase [Ruminococcus sp.]
MFYIRKANENEFEKVRDFYYSLIDMMQTSKYFPGWEKGIYPTDEYLKEAILKKELFVGVHDTKIIASMVVNREFNESYAKVKWSTSFAEEEVMIIHILGVLPTYGGKGYAKKLVKYAFEYAKQNAKKAVRLDVLGGNLPAEKLYTGLGFQYVDTIQMYYEDTGWTDFKLYEYIL